MSSLTEKIKSRSELTSLLKVEKEKGKKVVFTNGCFDILHAGHVCYLNDAKQLGDLLVLGLNSDASVQRLKGPTRPVNNQQDRALVLAALACIDYVVVFEEDTPIRTLEQLQPHIHVKGGDYTAESLPEYPLIHGYGGKVVILPFKPGNSTTSILEKL